MPPNNGVNTQLISLVANLSVIREGNNIFACRMHVTQEMEKGIPRALMSNLSKQEGSNLIIRGALFDFKLKAFKIYCLCSNWLDEKNVC